MSSLNLHPICPDCIQELTLSKKSSDIDLDNFILVRHHFICIQCLSVYDISVYETKKDSKEYKYRLSLYHGVKNE